MFRERPPRWFMIEMEKLLGWDSEIHDLEEYITETMGYDQDTSREVCVLFRYAAINEYWYALSVCKLPELKHYRLVLSLPDISDDDPNLLFIRECLPLFLKTLPKERKNTRLMDKFKIPPNIGDIIKQISPRYSAEWYRQTVSYFPVLYEWYRIVFDYELRSTFDFYSDIFGWYRTSFPIAVVCGRYSHDMVCSYTYFVATLQKINAAEGVISKDIDEDIRDVIAFANFNAFIIEQYSDVLKCLQNEKERILNLDIEDFVSVTDLRAYNYLYPERLSVSGCYILCNFNTLEQYIGKSHNIVDEALSYFLYEKNDLGLSLRDAIAHKDSIRIKLESLNKHRNELFRLRYEYNYVDGLVLEALENLLIDKHYSRFYTGSRYTMERIKYS